MSDAPRWQPRLRWCFWSAVFAGVCVSAAWKLDLLPGQWPPAWSSGDAAARPRSADSTPSTAQTTLPPELAAAQTEPGMQEATAQADETRTIPSASSVPQNPFGPATPEFVVLDEPTPVPQTDETGVVVPAGNSVAAEEAAFVATADAELESETINFTAIDAALAAGTADGDVSAHRQLSQLYWEKPEVRSQLAERIESTARRIYFKPDTHYVEPYLVQPGETLEKIAAEYEVSWEYLAQLNGLTPAKMRAGQKIKVVKGPFAAVVDLSDYELTVHCHGYFVYRFPIGTGKDGSTPVGTFRVQDKQPDPTYYGPDGVIEHDDPTNPLGERWLSLGDSYGIHGTIDPDSIGKSESRGCVRLHDKDVEIVYDLLTVGSDVVIQP